MLVLVDGGSPSIFSMKGALEEQGYCAWLFSCCESLKEDILREDLFV